MKILIQNYTFSASAKTVTFTDYTSISLDNILLITNVTTNTIIYNFACLGGTVSGNVLTLNYNTATMSDTDNLQIFYDNGSTPVSDETVWLLRRMVKLLESNAVVDVQNRQKVTIDGITNGLGALLGVAVAGLSSGAGVPSTNYPTNGAPIQQPGTSSWQPVWIGPVDQRYQIIDQARATYNLAIRNNLTF